MNQGHQMTSLQSSLVEAIKKYVVESPLNALKDIDGSPMWDEPIVRFADGDDPMFERYKEVEVIGPFHLTPREALAQHLAAAGAEPREFERVGVISWVLPTPEKTRQSNREMTEGPSLRWNHTRFHGEDFSDTIRRHVVGLLREQGYVATAPMIEPFFKGVTLANGPASNWSERHAAYAAGHGTFSLSDGLITPRGIAHRCGSVVFGAKVIPSPRPYSHHLENCLFYAEGTCGACIKRCPAGAISEKGHDKNRCLQYMRDDLKAWKEKPGYIGSYVACGLCQTKVPCERGIPKRKAGVCP